MKHEISVELREKGWEVGKKNLQVFQGSKW